MNTSLARKPVITVVGSFAVGMTLRTDRMPIFGETLLGSDFDLGPGGKGSNQAVAAARLGAEAHFVGLIGVDQLGEIAVKLYADEGVGTDHLDRTESAATGVGFIIVNPAGSNGIILDMGANKRLDSIRVNRAETLIQRSDVVLSVLEIPLEAAAAAMALARKHGVRTILNPAPATALPAQMLANVDLLTPNESELRILMGLPPDDPRATEELAEQLWRQFGVTVIVTCGEKGVLLIDGNGATEFPAVTVAVVDTTGAGDAFTAALAVGLGEGKELPEAIRFANCNGALACTRLGVIPALARRSAVDQLLSSQDKEQRT
jgi:ribokinase